MPGSPEGALGAPPGNHLRPLGTTRGISTAAVADTAPPPYRVENGSQESTALLNTLTPLSALPEGSLCRLESLAGERSFRRRLMELGLLPGADLRLVRRGSLAGLVELEVRGTRISMRKSEADGLLVSPMPHSSR